MMPLHHDTARAASREMAAGVVLGEGQDAKCGGC